LTLIFDNRCKGHHFEFIKHLLDLVIQEKKLRYIFLLHPKLIDLIQAHYTESAIKGIRLLPIPLASTPLNFYSAIKTDIKLIEQTISQYKVQKIIFMFFDGYQLMIGSKRFSKQQIAGILFNPPLALNTSSAIGRLKAGLKKWRKINQLKWCLRHKKLSTIYLLNDVNRVDRLNEKLNTNVFRVLIDPIEQINGIADSNVFTTYFPKLSPCNNIKTKLLMFGSMSAIKNLPNILKAISDLDAPYKEHIVLNIVGPYASEKMKAQLSVLIKKYQLNTSLKINRVEEFIDVAAIAPLFDSHDIVLMPYINFFGSSGVLGHAARQKKVVLATNKGIISSLVQHYQLGLTCEPTSSESIRQGLVQLIEQKATLAQKARFDDFLAGRTPKVFARTLLETN